MDRPMSSTHFKFMSFMFKFRDLFAPPIAKLKEAGIGKGFHILDYGCGPGSYSLAAARQVGSTGRVYALDIHPLAIQRVEKMARRKGIRNIETILSDRKTGLKKESIDMVLLYDTFHNLKDPLGVLRELHRIMKKKSVLSFRDHHMNENEIMLQVTQKKLFTFANKGKHTYTFLKA